MTIIRRGVRALAPRPVSWTTVGTLSVVLAVAGAFWLETVQGAVGALERAQGPFRSFVVDSLVLTPVSVVAVLAALALTRRLLHGLDDRVRTVLAASVLVVLAGVLTGAAALTAQAVSDYQVQKADIALQEKYHGSHGGTAGHQPPGVCLGVCLAERQTIQVAAKGIALGTGGLLATDAVLVAFVMAMRGGTLVSARRRAVPPAVAPAMESIPA